MGGAASQSDERLKPSVKRDLEPVSSSLNMRSVSVQALRAHSEGVQSGIRVTSSMFATQSDDGLVCVWHTHSGSLLDAFALSDLDSSFTESVKCTSVALGSVSSVISRRTRGSDGSTPESDGAVGESSVLSPIIGDSSGSEDVSSETEPSLTKRGKKKDDDDCERRRESSMAMSVLWCGFNNGSVARVCIDNQSGKVQFSRTVVCKLGSHSIVQIHCSPESKLQSILSECSPSLFSTMNETSCLTSGSSSSSSSSRTHSLLEIVSIDSVGTMNCYAFESGRITSKLSVDLFHPPRGSRVSGESSSLSFRFQKKNLEKNPPCLTCMTVSQRSEAIVCGFDSGLLAFLKVAKDPRLPFVKTMKSMLVHSKHTCRIVWITQLTKLSELLSDQRMIEGEGSSIMTKKKSSSVLMCVSGSLDCLICVWRLAEDTLFKPQCLQRINDTVNSDHFISSDPSLLAKAHSSSSRRRRRVSSDAGSSLVMSRCILKTLRTTVHSRGHPPSSQFAYVAAVESVLTVYDESFRLLSLMQCEVLTSEITAMACLTDVLITATSDGSVCLWNLKRLLRSVDGTVAMRGDSEEMDRLIAAENRRQKMRVSDVRGLVESMLGFADDGGSSALKKNASMLDQYEMFEESLLLASFLRIHECQVNDICVVSPLSFVTCDSHSVCLLWSHTAAVCRVTAVQINRAFVDRLTQPYDREM